jgi:hypothetical protein
LSCQITDRKFGENDLSSGVGEELEFSEDDLPFGVDDGLVFGNLLDTNLSVILLTLYILSVAIHPDPDNILSSSSTFNMTIFGFWNFFGCCSKPAYANYIR